MSPPHAFSWVHKLAAESDPARRSALFVWLSENREQFARHQHEHSWAAWTQALGKAGIRTISGGDLKHSTVRQTWWRVRTMFEMGVGEAVVRAEKAKVGKRRKPRRPSVHPVEPAPDPGEVVAGVRIVKQQPGSSGELEDAELKRKLADLRNQMRERSGLKPEGKE